MHRAITAERHSGLRSRPTLIALVFLQRSLAHMTEIQAHKINFTGRGGTGVRHHSGRAKENCVGDPDNRNARRRKQVPPG